ncbi:MAG: hypothetical protein WB014_06065 [Methanosarcina sp.]
MTRKKGALSKIGSKNNIIKIILENNGSVEESKIRQHIREKNEKIDQGNINRYLHELLKEPACIELKAIKKGRRKHNLWNVTTIEHLKNILYYFPEIQLNKYEKSVNIILKEFDFNIDSMRAKKAFVQLSLSVSFFNKLLETDIETLYSRALNFDQLDTTFNMERKTEKHTQNLIYDVYIECMERIQRIPGIWPVADEDIENSGNLDVYQNSPQNLQNSVISEEKLKRMLKKIKFSLEERDSHEQSKRIIRELSMKISHEILSKKSKEHSEESIQNQEILNKISDEIFKKLLEEVPIDLPFKANLPYKVDLPYKLYIIILNQYQNTSSIFDKIFYHFYQRDVIDGNNSHEEQEFVSEMNKLTALNITMKLDPWKKVEELDNLYNDYYEKCRKNAGVI